MCCANAATASRLMTRQDPFDAQRFMASLPTRPGVYLFYQEDGKALYVGKAANLRNRLASYFRSSRLSPKTKLMVAKIHRAEIQQTRTESEALLLENNLIKDKHPRYNIALRDDKSFPYIRLHERADFPYFTFYRGRRTQAQRYYGPYPNAAAVREMLTQLHKIFRLRQCNDAFFRSRSRPCLQYQIKRCSAPCVGLIAQPDYLDDVRQAKAMLEGRDFALLDELADKMEAAAAQLDFEAASGYRDRIALLQHVAGKQYVSAHGGDADVVAVALDSDIVCFGVMVIRRGRNLGGHFHIQKNPLDLAPDELLEAFLPQNYIGRAPHSIASEILLNEKINNRATLQQTLTRENKSKVEIKQNCRALRARWIESAYINTTDKLQNYLNQRSQVDAQVKSLAELLSLQEPPTRIECFDISHTAGEHTVGACVVCDQQGPIKSDYRRFNITGITPGDDYAAMQQTLMRRYKRVLQEDGKLPDMIILDGGKGQLRVASRVLEELQMLNSVVLLGVSKGPERRAGEEQLHLFGKAQSILPGKASPALHLIQRIRDEAHRFAITGHRLRRANARTESPLQYIDGVGEKRRRNLLCHFGGLREVTRAGIEDLSKAPGISPKLAKRIYHQFHD